MDSTISFETSTFASTGTAMSLITNCISSSELFSSDCDCVTCSSYSTPRMLVPLSSLATGRASEDINLMVMECGRQPETKLAETPLSNRTRFAIKTAVVPSKDFTQKMDLMTQNTHVLCVDT
eukprot:Selendium_serpulae@DN9356_c0_g1_i1.p1